MDGSGAARRRIWTAELDEIERLASVQPEADVQHARTRPGPFRMRMTVVDFGPLRIQSAAVSNSYLVRGALRGDFHALLMPARPWPGSRLNGVAVEATDAVALRAGSEVQSHVAAGHRWFGVMLHPSVFGPALAPLALEAAGRVVSRGLLAAAPGLLPLLSDLAGHAAATPDCLEAPAVAGAVVEDVQRLLDAGLRGAALEPPGVADRRRLRMFREAVEFLDTVLGRPVYSAAVGKALGVDPRAVNGAFRAVYGMTLHRYLLVRRLVRRLALARERLLGAADAPRVKTVALDLGFWHLGRFAGAYRGLYGEEPSATLERARGRMAAGAG